MKGLGNLAASVATIGDEASGQRVDNFLLRTLKGVPRSHVYRIVRSGEVRVNGGRVDATYRLRPGDQVRIPPVRVAERSLDARPAAPPREFAIVHEDDALVVIDKPSGVAVHGGSGVSHGVIERLRAARPGARMLELAHRLDRETSGLLVVAKKRSALAALHALWRDGAVRKEYLAMVKGRLARDRQTVRVALRKYLTPEGERRVSVDREAGRAAATIVERIDGDDTMTLVRAILETGRTHQIRVHLAHLGHPLLGDDKYGDFDLNKRLAKSGLGRMFLHAHRLRFAHPLTGETLDLVAPLPPELAAFAGRFADRVATANHA
jgi:23S rRNA pseudouridine955/2504/2580 synthase